MAALVTDLQIVYRGDQGKYFQFTWTGNRDEWRQALEALKREIPPEAREYDEVTKVWMVAEAFEDVLGSIFRNFEGALDGIRSQLGMSF
jgi:hypothetical protein